MSVPNYIPGEITKGETVEWQTTSTEYPPADGWTLTTYFRCNAANSGVDVVASVDGSDYLSTMTLADSAKLTGRVDWQAWVSKGAEETLERHQIGSGFLEAKPGFVSIDADDAHDGRSAVKQTLDAIRAALTKTATRAQLERTVGNKTIRWMSIEELIKAETRFQQLYNQELQADQLRNGGSFLPNVYIRLK